MTDLLVGMALVLIFEGIILFALPNRLFNILNFISKFSDRKIRMIGIISIIIGLVLLCLIRL